MKLKLITVVLALAATPALAAMGTTEIPTFAGQAAAKAAANSNVPQSPEAWLARMTDFSHNLSAFKDPKVFVPWTNAVTEPGFYVAMMNGMMDPGGWLNMMNSAAHPDAVRNLVQFADPNIYLKWAAATGDPNFYTAVLTQLSDPGKLMRWGMLPLDPKLWNTLLSTLNPNTYIRWGMAGLDPRAWNLAGTMANPALYTGMMGAVVNPNSYGQGNSNWLTWAPQPSVQGAGSFAMWDPVAMLGNLSGFVPGINLSALPTLPNIGIPTITLPTFPAAAPTFNPATVYAPTAAPTPAAKAAVAAPVAVATPPAAVEAAKPVEVAKPAVVAKPVVEAAKLVEVVKPAEPTKAVAAAPAPEVKAAPVAKPVEVAKPAEPTKAVVAAPKVEVKAAPAPTPVVVAAPVAAPAATPVPESNKVILAGDALFMSGKSGIKNLSKDGKTRLDEIVAKIKAMGEIEQIKVVGHADPTGNAKSNQVLSEARAKSVRSYLVAKGVKPGVIITSGMGDTQPVTQCDKTLASADLKVCHAPNRRVEIEIIGKAK
ncbi:MAG: OmpA family protein [Gammaproteobacteria bacterium]|nr:OmpA family protein [Gammaproteobacteria bacterium]